MNTAVTSQPQDSVDSAHLLDEGGNLVGVCSRPASGIDTAKPCVIFINAGFLHRVGPNRMNTLLARALAAQGFCSMRMDLSGLGDSLSAQHVTDNNELVSVDITRCMEYVQREFGVGRFILMGLCSGAYDTSRMAMLDPRIVGLLNIDGAGYRTPRFYINHLFMHLLRRAFDLTRWRRLMARYRAARAASTPSVVSAEAETQAASGGTEAIRPDQRTGLMSVLAFTDMSRDESGNSIQEMAQRGVKQHYIFTGGVSGFYNYQHQFRDMYKDFDFGTNVSYYYFPKTDHLTMLEQHRLALHENIVQWVVSRFSTGSTASGNGENTEADGVTDAPAVIGGNGNAAGSLAKRRG